MRSAKLLLVASLSLSACSLSLEPDELDPLKSAEGFCNTLVGELANKVASCQGAVPGTAEGWYDGFLAGECRAFAAADSRGSIGYSPGSAASCIAEVKGASCSSMWEGDESCGLADRLGIEFGVLCRGACGAAVVGTRGSGGACSTDLDCAAPAWCSSAPATCGGTCLARGRINESCAPDAYGSWPGCEAGLYCDLSYVCRPLVGTWGPCSTDSACNPALQLYCNTSAGLCYPKQSEWDWCDASNPCVDTAECLWDEGYQDNFCVPFTHENESCAAGTRPCAPGLVCDDLGYCVRWPTEPAPLGGDCHWPRDCDEFTAYCQTADPADPSHYTCVARKTSGACSSDDACAVGYRCDLTGSNSCVRQKGLGESCTAGQQECAVGSYCSASGYGASGKCAAWPSTAGAPCRDVNGEWVEECHGLACVPTGPSTGQCQRYRRAGEACMDSDECEGYMLGAMCDGSFTCTPACL